MRKLSILIFFIQATFVYAQNFRLIGIVPNSFKENEISVTHGVAGLPNTPTSYYVDEKKQEIIVWEHSRAIKFFSFDKGFNFTGFKKYTSDTGISLITQCGMLNLYKEKQLFFSSTLVFIVENWKNILFSYNKDTTASPFFSGRLFPFLETIFYYSSEGNVQSLDFSGKKYGTDETKRKLDELNKKWRLANGEPGNLTEEIRHQYEAGKMILIGNEYYNSDWKANRDFFIRLRNSEFNPGSPQPNYFLGYDAHHNAYFYQSMYWVDSKFTQLQGTIVIYSKTGRFIKKIDFGQLYKDINNDMDGRPFLVPETGNIYFMFPHETGTRFYVLKNDWDVINIDISTESVQMSINYAREGMTEENKQEVTRYVESLSVSDLRLLRNAVFALYGYVFKSEDLKAYFSKFNWYMPDPKVKSDEAILTDAQRRLLEKIKAAEAGKG